METISVTTEKRCELIDITDKIQRIIDKKHITKGVCFIYVPHTTAGVIINENADRAVSRDIINTLSLLIPENKNYSHLEGNADSHVKSSLLGNCLFVFIENGRICIGAWQGIFFAESDGPRQRNIWINILEN